MTDRLSIITINRNNAEGLQRTIESVLMQTFKSFEYIVIDGASEDNSLQKLYELLMTDKVKMLKSGDSVINGLNVKWLSESDTGVFNAMNKGIKMATGTYLLFLNSGDFLIDNTVIKDVLSSNFNADIVCGRCNISKNGKVIHTTNPPDFVTFGTLYLEGLAHQATFIKKKLFDKFGLYDETFRYNADIDFWYKSIILGGASTQKIEFTISDYNLDGISTINNQSEDFKAEHKRILSQPVLKKIVPDFEQMKKEKSEMSLFYWAKSKRVLYIPLNILYKIANHINGKK